MIHWDYPFCNWILNETTIIRWDQNAVSSQNCYLFFQTIITGELHRWTSPMNFTELLFFAFLKPFQTLNEFPLMLCLLLLYYFVSRVQVFIVYRPYLVAIVYGVIKFLVESRNRFFSISNKLVWFSLTQETIWKGQSLLIVRFNGRYTVCGLSKLFQQG